MAGPYVVRPAPRRSLVGWLRRSPRTVAALVEVENALARAARVQDVTRGTLDAIEERRGLNLGLSLAAELEALFVRHLDHCLDDQHMSDDEVEQLVHLKGLFGIPDRRARALHDEIAGAIFRGALEDRMNRWGLRPDYQAFLDELRTALLLSDRHAAQLHGQVAATVIEDAERDATADVRLSPEEEGELTALAMNLGVLWPTPASEPARLQRMRDYWRVDNMELPVIEAEIPLPPGETIHFAMREVAWTAGRRDDLIGLAIDRLAGFLRDGGRRGVGRDPHLQRRSAEGSAFDTGDLYFSNRQLHFAGKRHHRSIPLLRITRVRPGDRRLAIERVARGPTVILELPGRTDETYVLLTRLIREAQWRRAYQSRLGRGADAPWWRALPQREE